MTLKKIDHTFAYDQLSYDAKPNEQPYLKLSFFFSKSDDVSYEHFHRHWQSIHSDLTIGTKAFKTNKILRYVQLHSYPELKKTVANSGTIRVCHFIQRRLVDLTSRSWCARFWWLLGDLCKELWRLGQLCQGQYTNIPRNCNAADDIQSEEFQKALMPDAPRMGMKLPFRCFASYENIIFGPALTEFSGTPGVTADTPRADGKWR